MEAADEAIHVRDYGTESAAGTEDDPLGTLAAAVELSRTPGGLRRIVVGAGRFPAALRLAADDGDEGLVIEGCGPGETVLVADDETGAVVRVTEAEGVVLRGLGLEGGRRGLWIWRGAGVSIDSVAVQDSARVGVIVDGASTTLDAIDLVVENPTPESGRFGYGISIQGAHASTTGGGVYNATGVGVLVDGLGAAASLDGLTVEGTVTDARGYLGRGIQVQSNAVGTFSNCDLMGNSDAGLHATEAFLLELNGLTVSGTLAAGIPDAVSESGDGIVVSQGLAGTPVSYYQTSIIDCEVEGSARSGVLLDGVTVAALSGNLLSENGHPDGSSVLLQGGTDATAAVDTTFDLVAAEATLDLNLETLDSDALDD